MTELTSLKGIGPKTAEAFLRLGISDVQELLDFFPRDYEMQEPPKPLYQLENGRIETVSGVLLKEPSLNFFNGMRIVNAYLSDMTGRLQLSWYHLPYIKNSLKTGVPYVFRGRVYEKNGRKLMVQPKVYSAPDYEENYAGRLLPVYPLTKGVTNALVQKAVREALSAEAPQKDWLPLDLRRRNALCEINFAYSEAHFPESEKALLEARKRLCFDDFFFFLLGIGQLRQERGDACSDYRCRPDFRLLKFIADLPFSLTPAQQKAYREITADMSSGRIMNRLLEGDVGSGKTIVALLAMLFAALNGYQAALMAPTEVLAAQHYETVCRYLNASELPLSAVLLTGSMSAAQKRDAYAKIKRHEADLIIGTHAVFQEKAEYDRLGLVVTDEQHRFGVGQRERLSEKGGKPHVLVMSATPIPRTLAIILYGELDISVIDALPEGRQAIKNCVVAPNYRRTAYKFILDEVKKGHQAYVICPMIEAETDGGGETEAEAGDGSGAVQAVQSKSAQEKHAQMQSVQNAQTKPAQRDTAAVTVWNTASLENVTDYAKRLRALFPKEVSVGILHGRMTPAQKDEVMRAFKNGEIKVLVSTTVVEVGVDVPNATVMMIENADRFGLAQLHQLRGRVGRGSAQSYCIMMNTSESGTAAKRLDVLNHSNDGFYIAEQDLKLRGPGDLFGVRQSGELSFRMADIYSDAALLSAAKKESDALLSEDAALQKPEHRLLSEKLAAYTERAQMRL